MKKTKMLKKNYEFKEILKKGNRFAQKNLIAYIYKNKNEDNLLGIAISKKLGKAFKRNKIKRFIREIYKENEENLKNGYTIIFLIKYPIDKLYFNGFYQIKEEMKEVFKKANLLKS